MNGEYIMWNSSRVLGESQAGIKTAWRDINRYSDDTTLMAESKEELKSILMKVQEEWKTWNSTFKKLRSWHPNPIISWQIEGEKLEAVTDFIFLVSKITADGDCNHEIKRCLLLGREAMTNLVQFSHSVMSDSATPWTAARQAALSITNFWITQTHVWWVGKAIQSSHPLLSSSPPAFNLSQYQGLFKS